MLGSGNIDTKDTFFAFRQLSLVGRTGTSLDDYYSMITLKDRDPRGTKKKYIRLEIQSGSEEVAPEVHLEGEAAVGEDSAA